MSNGTKYFPLQSILINQDPLSLTRVLEIATQDLKALPQILDARPFLFSIDLAALASRREFLLLEKWVILRRCIS